MPESKEEIARGRAIMVVEQLGDNLINSLPTSIKADRFKAAFVNLAVHNPDIFHCTAESIRSSIIKCANDGLLPDGRLAAIVRYNNRTKDGKFVPTAQYIPMVQGIISRARDFGDTFSVTANVVHHADRFEFDEADPEHTVHTRPPLSQPRGDVIGAYAIFRDQDRRVIHREVMDLLELKKTQAISRSKGGPWANWFSEMCRKTVIRRGAKYVPMSAELRQIIERDDEHYDLDLDPNETPENYNPLAPAKTRVIEHADETETVEESESAAPNDADAAEGPAAVSAPPPQPNGSGAPSRDAQESVKPDEAVRDQELPIAAPEPAPAPANGTPAPTKPAKPGIAREWAIKMLSEFNTVIGSVNLAKDVAARSQSYWVPFGGFPDEATKIGRYAAELFDAHQSRVKGTGNPGEADAVMKRIEGETKW